MNLVLLLVGDHPQRVGIDGLFKLALLPPFVVSPEEICKQFQSSCAVGEVDTFVVRISVSFAAPRCQLHAQAFACSTFGVDDDDGIDRCVIAGTWILNHLHVLDIVRLNVFQFLQVSQLAIVQVDEGHTLSQDFKNFTFFRDHRHS